jgi:hypothetical protein
VNKVIKNNVMIGPVCLPECVFDVCMHESCNKIEAVQLCPMLPQEHGMQEITETGSFGGYAGGQCYYAVLACGCVDMDESNDVLAAM